MKRDREMKREIDEREREREMKRERDEREREGESVSSFHSIVW